MCVSVFSRHIPLVIHIQSVYVHIDSATSAPVTENSAKVIIKQAIYSLH